MHFFTANQTKIYKDMYDFSSQNQMEVSILHQI